MSHFTAGGGTSILSNLELSVMTSISPRRSLGIMLQLASILSYFSLAFQKAIIRHRGIDSFLIQKRAFSTTSTGFKGISQHDIEHMNLALSHARKGFGHTFPNPAVGCVLVRQDTNQVIGAGFHPRAGFPHAEVFALLEATGLLNDGSAAAEAVVSSHSKKKQTKARDPDEPGILEKIQQFAQEYSSSDGPERLFSSREFTEFPVTAYVTLEPCCHYGQTPPCAASLVLAHVSRVVVGFQDPNPRVDGGGVKMLKDANIEAVILADSSNEEAKKVQKACSDLVSDFVKRVMPKSKDQQDYSYITGAMRRDLRNFAGRAKSDGSLTEVEWNGEQVEVVDSASELEATIASLDIDPSWLERTDHLLWDKEIVLLRLNKAIKKKKGAKLLGERIAQQLQAHVAQTVGHTVLLYRPGIPPVLDLSTLGKGGGDL